MRLLCAICTEDLEPEVLAKSPAEMDMETPRGIVHLHCEVTQILETIPSLSFEPAAFRQTLWELGMKRGYL